jgi:hypothetical protein
MHFRGVRMPDKDIKMLVEAIVDYLEWERSLKANGLHRPIIRDSLILIDLLRFATLKDMVWEDMFIPHSMKEFSAFSRFKYASRALVGLSGFLSLSHRIPRPLTKSRRQIQLPEPFEAYLHKQSHRASFNSFRQAKGFLASFHAYLEKKGIALAGVKIEDLDQFLAELKVARSTRSIYRSHLRGFLKYLYRERRMLNKDLAAYLAKARPALYP